MPVSSPTVSSVTYTTPPVRGVSFNCSATIDGVLVQGINLLQAGRFSRAVNAWITAGNVPAPYVAPPPPPVMLDYLQFRSLFTSAENTAIMTAATTNHLVLDWLLQAAGAGSINLSDPLVTQGLAFLVGVGILTSDREAAILANQAPASS